MKRTFAMTAKACLEIPFPPTTSATVATVILVSGGWSLAGCDQGGRE